jgi:predicted transcriptional regulator
MVTYDNDSFKLLLIILYYNVQPINRQETEDLIIDLYYNQKKTFREIQKIVRKSPRDIRACLDKIEPERASLSPSSRAYQMFVEGKTPIEVAVALNLREKEANDFYREYWNLSGMYYMNQIHEEIQKAGFLSIVELYRQMKAEGLKVEHVIRLLKIANNDIPSIEYRYQELQSEEASLKAMNQQAGRTVQEINANIARERQTLEQFRKFVKQKQQEVERLYLESRRLEDFINQFQNTDETYTKIKGMVKEQI